MRLPCAGQLQRPQLQCSKAFGFLCSHGTRTLRVASRAKNSNQKNEGVYFEYEAVDPDAAEEIAALQEEDQEEFSWAQRSRDMKKAHQNKVRGLWSDDPRRQRKGGKRGWRANDAVARDRRQAAAEAAAATASDGPTLPSYSPVETPAMRARASTPEEFLIRPCSSAAGKPDLMAPGTVSGPRSGPSFSSADAAGPSNTNVSSSSVSAGSSSGSSSPASVEASGGSAQAQVDMATGSARRMRLLQRMKGASGAAAAAHPASCDLGTAAAAAPELQGSATLEGAAGTRTGEVAAAALQAQNRSSSYSDAGRGDTVTLMTEATATAAPTVVTAAAAAASSSAAASAAVRADLHSQFSPMMAQLPPESELPADAQQARALLSAILSPSGEDVREVTAGDVEEMLQRDLSAQAEFTEWFRNRGAAGLASSFTGRGRGGGDGSGGGGAAAAPGAEEEFTEAEAADLMAALANLDLEGDITDLSAELDLELEGPSDGNGDVAIGDAVRQVSELRQLMAQMDDGGGADGGGLTEEAGGAEDMTDEQVLEALKESDPALYELLKDVPEFDKLNLDLDLDLDLESAKDTLTEEELAELTAEVEASAGADGGGGGDEEEQQLEALLRDMRGLGLMREEAFEREAGGQSDLDDDDERDDDNDEGDLVLGDLLEAIGEEEGLDSHSRMRAQFALQSMLNHPAGELAAKGTRGRGGGGGDSGSDVDGLGTPTMQRSNTATTTGMARGAIAEDDEDGGAAPPPVLPKPTLKSAPKPGSA